MLKLKRHQPTNTPSSIERRFQIKTGETLRIRYAQPHDIEKLDALGKEIHWSMGTHNLKLIFDISYKFWEVIFNEKDQLIAFNAVHQFDKDFNLAYLIMTREDYRGMGIVSQLDYNIWLPPNKVVGSSTHYSIARFPNLFEIWLERKLSYYGILQPQTLQLLMHQNQRQPAEQVQLNFTIQAIENAQDFKSVVAYDQDIVQLDRSVFLEHWALDQFPEVTTDQPQMSFCCAAFDNKNTVIGYACMRWCDELYMLSPVYADNDVIVWHLLLSLVANITRPTGVYITALADRRVIHEFARAFAFYPNEFEHRNANERARSYVRSLKMDKVYAPHEFWPV